VKLALLVLALLLTLSLVLGEVPLGDAGGCVLLPFTLVLGVAGAALVAIRTRRFVTAALILLIALHIAFGPLYYRGAAIESRVVDEADDPVADARVVAMWETSRGRTFARVETRTDRTGTFMIEPWGPRLRLPFEVLDRSQPTITASAPGFTSTDERDDSLGERLAAVSGEQWQKEIVLYRP
jgi:hypothetical protein